MSTHKTPPLQGLFLLLLLPLALLTLPNPVWADHEQVAQASGSTQMAEATKAEAPKAEGSKSKGPGHGSPKGMMGGPHGKSEGSGSKKGYGKGYGHGSKHGYGKREGSRGKHGYGKHGYSRHGYGGHRGGHGNDPFRHVLRFAKSLGLTADQIGKIKNMKFEFSKMRIMLKAHHQVAHMELEQLVHSREVKESEMREVADRIAEIKSKKIHSMVEAKIGLLKLLTPEQRKKMSQVHSKR